MRDADSMGVAGLIRLHVIGAGISGCDRVATRLEIDSTLSARSAGTALERSKIRLRNEH
jgi:hypothetical protein